MPAAWGMKAAATGMLVVMAGIFVLASALQDRSPAWGFVKAVLSQVWSCEVPAPQLTRALDVALSLEPRLR